MTKLTRSDQVKRAELLTLFLGGPRRLYSLSRRREQKRENLIGIFGEKIEMGPGIEVFATRMGVYA